MKMRDLLKLQHQVKRSFASKKNFAKPYKDIPGPRGFLGLGNLYNYLPIIGKYSWLELHKAGYDKYQRYGPIVKETMVLGQDIVWLYEPQDIATLLNCKDYPQRRSHLALEKYRLDRPHVYRSAGLLPTNGAEWWRLRSELQKEISAPKSVRSFLMAVDKVTKEFLRFLPKSQDMDILPHLARLNLELTCLVTFGERLYSFSPEELDEKSRSSKLIRAAETTNSNILPTDQGLGLWRHYETGPYKKLRKAQEYMESVAVDLVSSKLVFFKDEEESIEEDPDNLWSLRRNSLVEEYMKNPNLDLFDVVGMAADLLLAGIDTTSYTTAFALYHISRHSEVQRRIYEEALTVLPSKDSPLLADSLKSGIPYTRATLKEVFRLNPISVGVGRILTKNLIFSGYHVPKNTVVVTQNMVACRLEKNFQDPFTFNPDRWLGNAKGCINPYLVLPFGHGMRSCIARRLAEQNILTFLLRLIRNYEIEWKGDNEDMDVITLLINKPSQPVTIEMKERFQ